MNGAEMLVYSVHPPMDQLDEVVEVVKSFGNDFALCDRSNSKVVRFKANDSDAVIEALKTKGLTATPVNNPFG